MSDKTTPFVLRLDPATRAQLKTAAAAEDRPAAYVASRAIRLWLQQRQDAQAAVVQQPPAPAGPVNLGTVRDADRLLAIIREAIAEHGVTIGNRRSVPARVARAIFVASRPGMSSSSNNVAWSRGLMRLRERGVIGHDEFSGMLWLD